MKNLILIVFLLIFLYSCSEDEPSNAYPDDFNGPKYHFTCDSLTSPPNYSSEYYWMALPEVADKEVDVFWLYLTVFVSDKLWNMPVDVENNRVEAQITIPWQAAVFNEDCNIYAPYYRQACIGAFYAEKRDFDSAVKVAIEDSKSALLYYLKNYNNGRPFILAGHSQGSMITKELLKDEEIVPYLDRMIAAYMPGWFITPEELSQYPQLAPVEDEAGNGKVILFNSVENGYQDRSITINENSPSVNPLLWNTSGEKAERSLHLGARVIIFGENGDYSFDTIPDFTSAQNIRGGLCIERPGIVNKLNLNFAGIGIYHIYDYDFFYFNIKANLKKRIEEFDS